MCSEGLRTCTVKYSWNSRGGRRPGKSLGPGRDRVKRKGREEAASLGQTLCGAFHGELLQRDFVLASPFSRVSGVWLQARKFDLPLSSSGHTHSSLRSGPLCVHKMGLLLEMNSLKKKVSPARTLLSSLLPFYSSLLLVRRTLKRVSGEMG